jgi:Uma2 family endonuclease
MARADSLARTDPERVPELVAGDRLTRDEFERRYHAMPHVKKAELIEGMVYMPSPVRTGLHGRPHVVLATWIGTYMTSTPGTEAAGNATVRLDLENEPQPDVFLRLLPAAGGQSPTSADDYVEGAPELAAEVTASTASYDLHPKKRAYLRNGVREYVVWRTQDEALDWFVLRAGRYARLRPEPDGLLRSPTFPGLWLDPAALLAGDYPRVLLVLQQGLASPEHAAFVARLRDAAGG